VSARDLRGLARGVGVFVDPRRLTGPGHHCRDIATADGRASPHRRASRTGAPAPDRRHRAVAVEAANGRRVGIEQFANLSGHGLEDFTGVGVSGDERRDTSQGGLFLSELC
jgi:hypothetical protein